MMHSEVEIIDAITAVILLEVSLERNSSLFCLDFNLNADFPEDPNQQHKEIATIILKKLDLLNLLEDSFLTEKNSHLNQSYETSSSSLFMDKHINDESYLDSNPPEVQERCEKSISDDCIRKEENNETDVHKCKTKFSFKKRLTHEIHAPLQKSAHVSISSVSDTDNSDQITSDKSSKCKEQMLNNLEDEKQKNSTLGIIKNKSGTDSVDKPIGVGKKGRCGKFNLQQFRFKPREQQKEEDTDSINDLQMLNLIPSVNDIFYDLDIEMQDSLPHSCLPDENESAPKRTNVIARSTSSVFEQEFDDTDLNI